jgi:ubiquinone/menaquinone biosynthesis C-methylase UbiE
MTAADVFGKTDQLDAATLDALAARFEARGKHAAFADMLTEYLDAMQIAPAASVLDLGCGTGLVARAIARHASFTGSVAGIDLSPHLVAAATRLAEADGVSARVTFQSGDARRLPFADASFDAVVAHTLISHVNAPLAVLQEAARVLKASGTLAVFDGDYASLTFDQADEAKARADDAALARALVANPRVMGQMPRLLRAAGFELLTSFAHVLAEVGTADFWLSGIETFRRLLHKAGAMTEAQADAWAAGLRAASEAGVFFGRCNYHAFLARRSSLSADAPEPLHRDVGERG